ETCTYSLHNSFALRTRKAFRPPTASHAPLCLHCAASLGLTTNGKRNFAACATTSSMELQTTVAGTGIPWALATLNKANLSKRHSTEAFCGRRYRELSDCWYF